MLTRLVSLFRYEPGPGTNFFARIVLSIKFRVLASENLPEIWKMEICNHVYGHDSVYKRERREIDKKKKKKKKLL